MKAFIRRHPLSGGVTLFILISLLFAFAAYKTVNLSYSQKEILKSIPWSMEPTDQYISIFAGETPGQFEAYDGEKGFLIDATGRVLKEIPDDGNLGEGLFLFEKEDLCGVKDASGKVVIEAKYRSIEEFHHGYAIAWDGSRHKLLNRDGSQLLAGEVISTISYIKSGKYFVNGSTHYILDVSTGDKTPLPSKVLGITTDDNGSYMARLPDDTYCYLTDAFAIPQGAVLYKTLPEFSEGLAYVERYDDLIVDEKHNVPLTRGHARICGYMNESHEIVLPLAYKDIKRAHPFAEGKALIYADKKIICIDTKGKTLFVLEDCSNSDPLDTRFTGGYASLSLDGKKEGIIDEEGKFIFEPIFDSVGRINAGYAAVRYKEQYGIINLKEGI